MVGVNPLNRATLFVKAFFEGLGMGAFPLAVLCPCGSNLVACMYCPLFALMCVFTSSIPFSPEPLSFVYVDAEAVDLNKGNV